ncbi:TetR/AcrR family transcriptional regulator [Piscinibacter sp.]|jgi:AcrR family transcriptional regulator|uniref:TetR/AcrR family transcriptional regulator n=1 Tax=Piscinibacter sp. TaxID=1903157 RepID=UPI00355986D9
MATPPRKVAAKAASRDRRRAVRVALSRERIVDAALELIHVDGLAAFSTRKLGQRLGCEAMSIYHHFPSKQHLLDALVEHAISSVEVPEPGPDATAHLRRSLYSYRAMARRWPALFPLVAVHRLNTPTGVRFIEAILRLIRSVEPDTERAARQFRVMGYYLVGAGLEETAGYARGPSAAEPVSDEYIGRHCPNLIAVAPYFQQGHWDATFDLGIELLLEGMQRAGEARLQAAGNTAELE